MGEGRAARNTLPACQELLARVGAWAGEGGGCPCSRRLLTSFSRAQQSAKDGTIREGSAAPHSPLPPKVPRAGNTSLVLTARREAAHPPPPPRSGAWPYFSPTRVSATPRRPRAQQ